MSNDEQLARVANILGCESDYGMITPALLELKRERDELKERKPACAWCGYEGTGEEAILMHIITCEKRPERDLSDALEHITKTLVCTFDLFRKANSAKRETRKEVERIKGLVRDYWQVDDYTMSHFVNDALGDNEAREIGVAKYSDWQDASEYR